MAPILRARETVFGKLSRVDRGQGILYGCKLLGKSSRNGREYTDRALASAAKLYESLGIDLDHQRDPRAERSIRDLIGIRPRNVRVTPDGVYGDVHLLLSDPLSAKILEAAERDPHVFGFSHEADLEGSRKQNKVVVESVTKVHSLDLVRHPATTQGAFESMDPELTKVKEAEEEAPHEDSCKELLARAMVLAEKEGDVELARKIHRLIKPEEGEEGVEEDEEEEIEGEGTPKESVGRKVPRDDLAILARHYGIPEGWASLIKPEATMTEILTAFESYRPRLVKRVGNVEQGTHVPVKPATPDTDRVSRFKII